MESRNFQDYAVGLIINDPLNNSFKFVWGDNYGGFTVTFRDLVTLRSHFEKSTNYITVMTIKSKNNKTITILDEKFIYDKGDEHDYASANLCIFKREKLRKQASSKTKDYEYVGFRKGGISTKFPFALSLYPNTFFH